MKVSLNDPGVSPIVGRAVLSMRDHYPSQSMTSARLKGRDPLHNIRGAFFSVGQKYAGRVPYVHLTRIVHGLLASGSLGRCLQPMCVRDKKIVAT